jgi:hypothetical protein
MVQVRQKFCIRCVYVGFVGWVMSCVFVGGGGVELCVLVVFRLAFVVKWVCSCVAVMLSGVERVVWIVLCDEAFQCVVCEGVVCLSQCESLNGKGLYCCSCKILVIGGWVIFYGLNS